MRLTQDNVFIDTNILIYAYSETEKDKQSIAQELITNHGTYISTQVLQELCNTLFKKFKVGWTDIEKAVNENIQNNVLYINTDKNILHACQIADRYKYSFYDSLIISAALYLNCRILYSEDLQHEQIIDGRLKIINPFMER